MDYGWPHVCCQLPKIKSLLFKQLYAFMPSCLTCHNFRYMEPESKCGDAPLILKQEANKNHNRKEVRKNIIYKFLIQLF